MDTDKTYVVAVMFTVYPHSDAYLQSPQAIENEFRNWLESLKATVDAITVKEKEEQ